MLAPYSDDGNPQLGNQNDMLLRVFIHERIKIRSTGKLVSNKYNIKPELDTKNIIILITLINPTEPKRQNQSKIKVV